MKKISYIIIGFAVGALFMAASSRAEVTPSQLQEMLNKKEKVTVIDIRGTAFYTQGHIPGAVNIPAAVIALKKLPEMGYVVVCGDGLRTDLTTKAVAELTGRNGIQAEMLQGGFSAWDALDYPTTHEPGFSKRRVKFINYSDLEKIAAHNPNVVLVDLREQSFSQKKSSADNKKNSGEDAEEPSETDLKSTFPGKEIIRLQRDEKAGKNHWDVSGIIKNHKGFHYQYQYVVIDNGEGEAEKIASRIFAAGIKRVVVLAGGEITLQRQGKPGYLNVKKTQAVE